MTRNFNDPITMYVAVVYTFILNHSCAQTFTNKYSQMQILMCLFILSPSFCLMYTPLAHLRISISFSSLVLVTGFYRSGLQAFLKAKLEAEKKTKEQEDAEKHLTMKDLKGMNAQLEKELKTLQDENRTLRILCQDHDSGDMLCVCVCVCAVCIHHQD